MIRITFTQPYQLASTLDYSGLITDLNDDISGSGLTVDRIEPEPEAGRLNFYLSGGTLSDLTSTQRQDAIATAQSHFPGLTHEESVEV